MGRRRAVPEWAKAGPRRHVQGPDLLAALDGMPITDHLDVLGPVRSHAPLASWPDVRILELRSVRLGDLSALTPLRSLVNLQLRLGSVEHLDHLATLAGLRYVEVWMVRGAEDVRVLGRLGSLECFFLQDLPRVAALPDLAATAVRSVWLEHMRGLVDLRPLATAPLLEEVSLVACQHMQPADFLPLLDCPRLRRVGIGLGSDRKNKAVRDLLGIRGNYGGFTIR